MLMHRIVTACSYFVSPLSAANKAEGVHYVSSRRYHHGDYSSPCPGGTKGEVVYDLSHQWFANPLRQHIFYGSLIAETNTTK